MALGVILKGSFAIRVDVDTVKGLVDGIPPLLEILDDYDVRATFFASVGTDTASRSVFTSFRGKRHLSVNPLKKYGAREILGSLRGIDFSSHADKYREIQERGHEVQLHCHNHLEWVKKIGNADQRVARLIIQKGISAFQGIFGRAPHAFASPGFQVTDAVLDAEEELGFNYASDYQMEGDCMPFRNGRKVLQIPVNAPLIEDLVVRGSSDEAIKSTVCSLISGNSLTVMYLHPSYEPRMKKELLRSIIGMARESSDSVTLGEVFEKWNP